MHFTHASILAIVALVPAALTAPAPSLCKGPGGDPHLTNCLTPDEQACAGDWDTHGSGDLTGIQKWTIYANNVNEWDQTKFTRQLTDRACAGTRVKSNYDPATLILTTKFRAGSTCTPGRVTAALANSAGLRRVDCSLEDHPFTDPSSITGLLSGAASAAVAALGAI